MPVTYGHPGEPMQHVSTDLEQYTKWFDLMEIDFELAHIGSNWICNAWSRDKSGLFCASSGNKGTVSEALHQCYSDIRLIDSRGCF